MSSFAKQTMKKMLKRGTTLTAITTSALILMATLSIAQNKIQGRITEAATGEPVPFANVFFANTTFGAATDQNGNYAFSGFPPGKYDLTISVVGYNPTQRAVAFTQNQSVQIDVQLEPESKVLSEIFVKPDTLHWRRNYEDFKRLFLGTSRYAEQAVIQNPRDLHLYFDPQTSILVAHTKKPIIIENRATGYRITYYLYQFEFNARSSFFTIYGLPQFEVMTPKNKSEENKWSNTRAEIYDGSLLHFMRSWQQQRWQPEGFTVARLYRIPNRQRLSDEIINKKIAAARAKMKDQSKPLVIKMDKNGIVDDGDSIAYYMQMRSLPKEVDSVVNETLTGSEFCEQENPDEKKFTGVFRIGYNEKEDPQFARQIGRPDKIKTQQSLTHLLKPIKLYANGYYEDVRDVFLEEYWSWSEKIATLLPLDYQPPARK